MQATTSTKLIMAKMMHEIQCLSLNHALQLWSKELPSLRSLQHQINLIHDERTRNLDIGIYKCFNGQKKCTRTFNLNPLYQINGATLYSNQTSGTPILLIPSHINKGYIMDLIPEYSFAKKLESCGMSPYLLEWNDPSYEISHYSEAEYIENILIPIIDYISAQHNRKIIILGHFRRCNGFSCDTNITNKNSWTDNRCNTVEFSSLFFLYIKLIIRYIA